MHREGLDDGLTIRYLLVPCGEVYHEPYEYSSASQQVADYQTSEESNHLTFLAAEGIEDRLSMVWEIWRQNSAGLNDQQQMQLWQVLMEFKDLFAL
ncbi:unnamed protein product [Merluccius merluccius]